jgi:hypothetical protein
MTFQTDLEQGQTIERIVAKEIENKTGDSAIFAPEGRFKGYDFRMDKRHTDCGFFESRYEVKHDIASERTGNVAIEYEYKGYPSGIFTSVADWYAIVSRETCYIVPRNEILREMFYNQDVSRFTPAGDGLQSKCYLLPLGKVRILAKMSFEVKVPTYAQLHNLDEVIR